MRINRTREAFREEFAGAFGWRRGSVHGDLDLKYGCDSCRSTSSRS